MATNTSVRVSGAGPTGPTGASLTGPASISTGPTGAASISTGPTGAIQTGPTGPTLLTEDVIALGNCTGNQTLNLALGNVFSATLTGSGTWTLSNPGAAGKSTTVTIWLTNGGAFTITWATPPKWSGGVAPVLTASGLDIISLTTIDGGTTWCANYDPDMKVPS